MLIRRFAEGLGIFSVVLRMPDNAIDSIERQPMPEGVSGHFVPALLSNIKQDPDGVFAGFFYAFFIIS